MTDTIEPTADIIDIRDVTARFEELESEREDLENAYEEATTDLNLAAQGDGDTTGELETKSAGASTALNDWNNSEEGAEFKTLGDLLDSLKGYGGDEQWRGDWYPITLIARSYFVDYCRDLVSDIGDMPREIPSYIAIDWTETARNLEVDYSTVDFAGNEFLYR